MNTNSLRSIAPFPACPERIRAILCSGSQTNKGHLTKLFCLTLLCIFLANFRSHGADGFMIRVTAAQAPIKVGNHTLATVPRGTRLWAFEVKEDGHWAKVKVPGEEKKGWLHYTQIESIKHTDAEQAHLQKSYAHYDRYDALIRKQKWAEARRELEACLAIERAIQGNDHPWIADTLNNLGNLVSEQGDFVAAQNFYEEALAIYRKALGDEHTSTSMTLNNLGVLMTDQGDHAAARKYYEEALAIMRKVLGDAHIDIALTLNNLGILVKNQGDYEAARKYYDEALAIQQQALGDEHVSTANTLGNLGSLALAQGEYAAARKYYENALATYRKVLGDGHTSTASTLQNLGKLVSEQGDYSSARTYYEEALAIYREILGDEHPNTAMTLNNLGALVSGQGDDDAARTYYEEALAIRRKVLGDEHPDTAMTINNLGVLAMYHGDHAAAQKYLEEAVVVKRKVLGDEHPDTAMTLHNLGLLATKQGDYAAAQKYYGEALSIYRKVLGDEHPDTALTLQNLGVLSIDEEDLAAAASYLDRARHAIRAHEVRTLPSLSQAEQLQFLKNNHDKDWHYSLSFGLQQRSDPKLAALSASWLVNGKAVGQEALAAGLALTSPELKPQTDQLQMVRAQLGKVAMKPASADRDKQLAELSERHRELERKLAIARGQANFDQPWTSAEQVQAAMPEKSVLVNLARFQPYDFETKEDQPARYVAWLIPATGEIQIIDLGEAEPIDAAVTKFREAMAEADVQLDNQGEANAAAEIEQTLTPLVELVWNPLVDGLGDADELILSPDGALWLVPWAALPLEKDKFLLEKYRLRYAISGRELVAQQSGQQKSTKSVVMANPDYDLTPERARATNSSRAGSSARRSLTRLGASDPLPGTAAEARAIEPSLTSYGQVKPLMLLGADANESQFKQLAAPRVLMIGTHGFFLEDQEVVVSTDDRQQLSDDRQPRAVLTTDGKPVENPLLRCGLLLAGCNRAEAADAIGAEDGVLTGLEIVGTDLRGTELVVLSACDTGVGEVRNGEGVAGLRQAFELAGADSVVATLWQIPDNETVQLMTDFFVYLSQGQSRTDALRYAQLNRIREHRRNSSAAHPYYWAAFTINGYEVRAGIDDNETVQ